MDQSNLEEMHRKVVDAIGGLIETMCAEKGIEPSQGSSAMALAGNTVMSHLFLGIDPTSLGHAPFAGTLRAGGSSGSARFGASDSGARAGLCAALHGRFCRRRYRGRGCW